VTARFALGERPTGAVARIVIDRPARANALDRATLSAFAAAVREVELSPARAVVVSGAGERLFCGGADLDELAALDPSSAREFIALVHEACAALRDCPLPVLAEIRGACLGAGLELACACDLRIAADNACFGMPEVRLGIPSVIEAALLPRLVGAGRARWLVFTGEPIDAAQALAWGLVERVVPAASLATAVDATLDAILAGDDAALRAQKRLAKLWEEAPLDVSVRASIEEFGRAYESDRPATRIARLRGTRRSGAA